MACLLSFAAHAEKFAFQTAYDHFDFTATSKGGTYEGHAIDISDFDEGLQALTSALGNDCPALTGRPDITAKVGAQTKMVYVKQGVVSDGKTCLLVQGDGLYYLPIHRDFLNGPKRESIVLKSPIKVFRQGVKILSLHKQGKKWVSDTTEPMLDWDFLERWQNSLADYTVRLRVQEGIAADKPKMIVQSGNESYEFFKITDKMWAVKKPGGKWLTASDDWSSWYDFDNKILEDRYAGQIEFIQDSARDKESRLSALSKLENSWSPNLRNLYHKLVLDPTEDPAIQEVALKRLKRKPSMETAGVMVQFLDSPANSDLKREAGIILKLQNPKGPKYNPNGSEAEKAKALEFWRTWWKQNQNAE
jgi:hypothetical protein